MVTTVIAVWLGLYKRIVPLEEKKSREEETAKIGTSPAEP